MTDQLVTTGLIAGTWSLDAAHTTVGFTARHLMSKVHGTFNEFEGRITTTTDPLESTIAPSTVVSPWLHSSAVTAGPPSAGFHTISPVDGSVTHSPSAHSSPA